MRRYTEMLKQMVSLIWVRKNAERVCDPPVDGGSTGGAPNWTRCEGPDHPGQQIRRCEDCDIGSEFEEEEVVEFTAPPCQIPEGSTLVSLVVTFPYRAWYQVVEAYADITTGCLIARRIYEVIDDGAGHGFEDRWFDEGRLLHREGGPAHTKAYKSHMFKESYLDEAFERWYTHGRLSRRVNPAHEDLNRVDHECGGCHDRIWRR